MIYFKKEINRKNVDDFYAYMAKKFSVQYIEPNSKAWKTAKRLVSRFVPFPKSWLRRWAFSLPRKIWFPYVPKGRENNYTTLAGRIACLTHQLTHCRHWFIFKWLFVLLYSMSRTFRARAEAKAMQADIEMLYAIGLEPNIDFMLESLWDCGLMQDNVDYVKARLDTILPLAKKGKFTNPVVRAAIRWWTDFSCFQIWDDNQASRLLDEERLMELESDPNWSHDAEAREKHYSDSDPNWPRE